MAEPHVLWVLLRDAARGRFPPPDGTVRVVGSPPGRADAVVAFTAHNVIAAGIDRGEGPRAPPQPGSRGSGQRRLLARATARVASPDEPLFAQVSPGNVASVRAFLAAGYQPVCAEVLFLRPGFAQEVVGRT